ncbi:MAG: metallophosphoesterase, partial [Salinigranum sp.]
MLVLGDAHADEADTLRALRAAYAAAAAPVALQVGDLGVYAVPAPTWFVAGNNEDFDAVEALRRGDASLAGERDLHLLDGVAEVAGLRVAGLSGTYAPTQYENARSELAGERRRHFVREDVERVL